MNNQTNTKPRRFTCTIDPDFRGLGYSRLRDENCYLHCIVLFIFTICFNTSKRQGKKQIAKYITANTVEIDGKYYAIEYFSDIDDLRVVYYTNNLGRICKATQFMALKDDKILLFDDAANKWTDKHDAEVYIFCPDAKLEGYIKGNKFIAVKELSVG